uniref:Serine/threonine-protein kinase HT1 isoform X2 n=1 Tax=Rhizophora mucronata TaxID=61149 RepID=A0A2P2JBV2_RHIMU
MLLFFSRSHKGLPLVNIRSQSSLDYFV